MFERLKNAIKSKECRSYADTIVPVEIHLITKGWVLDDDGDVIINSGFKIENRLPEERMKELLDIAHHPDDFYNPSDTKEVMFIGVGLGTRLTSIVDFKVIDR